ncbi:MAG: bifunctional hydroxymethylpyrimidine kinase/phosphomethylpyrimidine kinase [Actinobacteria bacterium]|nr:bifunctional hydroxymethylpyrimidine kinase/phosphomethylpyrimidine kinase [Actinomycetota bacterium]
MGSPTRPVEGIPRALTIAGSDSGGGAGIQADLKTFMALGCHGMSAVTALTAQNTRGVTAIHDVPPDFVEAQIDAVVTDIGVDAAKTGMLSSGEIIEGVARAVERHGISNLVVDPVSVATSGAQLLRDDAVAALMERLLPRALIVTPNLQEAALLTGRAIDSTDAMKDAATEIRDLGPRTVLVKGGHLHEERAVDVFFDGTTHHEIAAPRFDTEDTHGTGCVLSAAIAARLAHGDRLIDAVQTAKEFVTGAIERGLKIGSGYGPVNPAWGSAP